ncbi:PE family protein [Mycobacterium tuberculosis]
MLKPVEEDNAASFIMQPGDVGEGGWRTSFPGATLKARRAAADDWVALSGLPTSRCRRCLPHTRTHAATYQTASAKAAVIRGQFVTTLATSASSYADTGAANAVVTG